eukprot:TRINITY_DN16918_c0_g1_i1.p4 TRINITY_DN16918_c0_g1~~TRINITY_DN16918_c0_g1_i1.p4  ORF type:complete len:121 (+),score=21.03 TRINITY_DN16918_c0_g1_i1:733-1095(+)
MIFDPLGVNGHIPFEEMEVIPANNVVDIIRTQIHAVDNVFAALKQSFRQGAADKAVYAQNQHGFLSASFRELPRVAAEIHIRLQTGIGGELIAAGINTTCLLYTSPSPRDRQKSRMPSSA